MQVPARSLECASHFATGSDVVPSGNEGLRPLPGATLPSKTFFNDVLASHPH